MTLFRDPRQVLSCRACFRRTFRSLTAFALEAAPSGSLPFRSAKSTSSVPSNPSRRTHATMASIRKGHHRSLLGKALRSWKSQPKESRSERLRGPSAVTRRNERAVELNKHHLDIENDHDQRPARWAANVDQALRTELAWTGGDALKLARAVLDKLRASDPARALEMVRASEKMPDINGMKAVDNVVSWNHVMDYHMSKAQTREAFKVFNEMKKRGHKPDAHTFTIMLRGYTMNHRNHNAVDEAMSVYNSIWRPESNIKPSILHSNAAINCLGRALDMDGLWSVAGRLPEGGPGSADKWTYTTILNTMQACALRDARNLCETDGDHEAAAKLMQTAIGEGRKLWEHVVSRWRSGQINIDQTLVCAMGRLLLLGGWRDWDDIYSLVEQTMRLPRANPPRRPWTPTHGDQVEEDSATDGSEHANQSSDLRRLEAAVSEEASATATNEFGVVDLSGRPSKGMARGTTFSAYANVGNNVLSLLIETAIKLREISVGKDYWARLTDAEKEPFVMPDDENLHTYLRLLRMSRSSKEASDLLQYPPNGASERSWYKRATFVLAMSTCARDFKNPRVFGHASTILDLMEAKLADPDLRVMTMYLSLAVIITPGISTEMAGQFWVRAGTNPLIQAVKRFSHSGLNYRLIMEKMKEKALGEDGKDAEPVSVSKALATDRRHGRGRPSSAPAEDLVEFLQNLNGAYDKLLHHQLRLTNQMAEELTTNKRHLSRALQQAQTELAQTQQQDPGPDQASRSLLPSAGSSRPGADLLAEGDANLRASRYPDKMANNGAATGSPRGTLTADGKIRGPRVVDLDKPHPFLRQDKHHKGNAARSQQTGDSLSVGGGAGWGAAWRATERATEREKGSKGQPEGQKEWVVV